jgi:hypothetical protein
MYRVSPAAVYVATPFDDGAVPSVMPTKAIGEDTEAAVEVTDMRYQLDPKAVTVPEIPVNPTPPVVTLLGEVKSKMAYA